MAEQDSATQGTVEKTTIQLAELDPREQAAYGVVCDICTATGLEISPEVRSVQPPYIEVELTGEDALASFGRNGKVLDALQYLTNLVIGRKVGPEVRVVMDAADYRARRIEALESLAREYATLVKTRQEECELDPLPANERRIIHNVLSDDPDIRTYSEGDDPDRRVIIAPR